MQGKEIIFMAPRSREHYGQSIMDAIIEIARDHNIQHYVRSTDAEGSDACGHIYSAHFFELTEEPEELRFVLDADKTDELIQAVDEAGINITCLQRPVEYLRLGSNTRQS